MVLLLQPRPSLASSACFFRHAFHSRAGSRLTTTRPSYLRTNHERKNSRANSAITSRALSSLTKSISRGPQDVSTERYNYLNSPRNPGLTCTQKPPLLPHTIPEHFASVVSRFGDRPAVICRSPTTITAVTPAALETAYTYHELDLLSNTLAHSLRSLGVKKGDRVAVSLGNCPEFAALTYAVFKLGAILVPLNPSFNAKQVAAALNHLEVRLLIIGAVTDLAYKPCRGRSNLPLLRELIPDLASPRGGIQSDKVPSLSTVVVVDNTPFHPLSDFPPLDTLLSLTPYTALTSGAYSERITPDTHLNPQETINIQFTSGTTSHPKAAMLSHTNILNNGHLIAQRMGLSPSDLIVCPPPLFHCFGSVLGYMATATTGAAILFPSPAFDPLANLRMVADHRGTGLYGVATMFVAMLEVVSSIASSSSHPYSEILNPESIRAFPTHLKKGIAAGSSVPESLMRKIYETLGLQDLVICYGMTETSPVSCMTTPHDPFEKRTQTVGRVMPHTRVKIVDPTDRTKVLPIGEKGELAASGYLVMKGYWGDEERTSEVRILEEDHHHDLDHHSEAAAAGGGGGGQTVNQRQPENQGEGKKESVWMYSGDEASMDSEGYIEITGRIKDLIIRGGENIHPLEIENCLFQHPLIAEASAVGVACPKYGEEVGVFVIVHKGVLTQDSGSVPGENGQARADGVEDINQGEGTSGNRKTLTKEDVKDWVRTHLSGHLVPKHVFWIDEYPKTASGKIQKFKLREMARDLVASS